jgi:splicing factor 3B subunit 2
MKVGELKQYVKRPDLVEPWDVTASDPLFLIWLKQVKNSVAVPAHWN